MTERHLHPVPDDWGTEGPEYSPDKFYCRSSDTHGHYRHVRVNVPPTMAGMLESMVESGGIPEYRTSQDVIRDAIVHRLEYLNKVYMKSEKYERVLAVERRRALVEQLTLQMQEFGHLVESIRRSISEAALAGDWYALQMALDNAEIEAEGPTMRDPYKGQILAIVDEARSKYSDALRRYNRER